MNGKNLSFVMFVGVFFIMVIAISSIGIAWILDTSQHANTRTQEEVQDLMAIFESELKQIILPQVDYIAYRRVQSEEILRADIKSRTYEAYAVLNRLYEDHKSSMDEATLKATMVSALRDIRFNDGRGYFFVDTLEGDVILYPTLPESEGSNLIDFQDRRKNYVVQEEIQMVTSQGEGYVEGFWAKPGGQANLDYKKITFVKLFEPFNWYLGCGEYLDDVETDIQNEILDYFNQLSFGDNSDRYIFVHDFKGTELANGRYPDLIGQNNYNLRNHEGLYVIQEQIRLAKSISRGGFLSHSWLDSKSSINKLTYVHHIEDWDWVIGTSLDLDMINSLIAKETLALNRRKQNQLIKILVIAGGVIVLSFIVVRYMAAYSKKSVAYFESQVDSAVENLAYLDADAMPFSDLDGIIEVTNQMTHTISSLMHIDEQTGMYNKKFILNKIEEIHYDGQRFQSLILLDIDNFGMINEKYGSMIGDEVIKIISTIIQQIIDFGGYVARYGGEEIIIVLPNTDYKKAHRIGEVIRTRISSHQFDMVSEHITISGSVLFDAYQDVSDTIQKLEALLYKAKKLGKNRIIGKDYI